MNRIQIESLRLLITSAIICGAFAVAPYGPTGCAYLATPNGQTTMHVSEDIAKVALEAAATNFGGPLAGQLAASGLDALGTVMQGYIDTKIPPQIVKAAPGIQGVGPAVAPLIPATVTQTDVNAVFQAAKIAAKK